MDVYVNCETIPQEFLVSSVACFFVFAFERRLHMVSDILSHSIALALPIIQFPCSFFNLSVTSPMSQLILQPFRHFTYVTAHSPTFPLLHLRHSSFSNPSFASPTSQALHLCHLASRPCRTAQPIGTVWMCLYAYYRDK